MTLENGNRLYPVAPQPASGPGFGRGGTGGLDAARGACRGRGGRGGGDFRNNGGDGQQNPVSFVASTSSDTRKLTL